MTDRLACLKRVETVSFVIPAYNEEDSIEETVRRAYATAENAQWTDAEVLVISDASTDATTERARKAGATVIEHPSNKGYGFSIKHGILRARHDTIVITDADGTYPIEAAIELADHYEQGFDLVVGERTGKHYRESWHKDLMRHFLRFLVEFTAGQAIPDINSGLRIFSRQAMLPLLPRLCDTFSFTTSQTLAYLMTGRFIQYMKIDYQKRNGNSKVRLFRDSLRTLQYIIFAVLYYNPIKIFLLIMGLLLVLATGCIATHVTSLLTAGMGYPTLSLTGGVLGAAAVIVFCLGLISEQMRQALLLEESSKQPPVLITDENTAARPRKED